MKQWRRAPLLTVSIFAAAILSGCTAPGNAPQSEGSSASPSSSVDAEGSGADAAGIDPNNPPEAIAATNIAVDNADGTFTTLVEIVRMRHVEDALVLTFRFTAEGTSTSDEELSIFGLLGQQSLFPYLIDYKNLKRYGAVPGLLTDITAVRGPLGEPLYADAVFAYPENADVVDILINTGTPALENVPVPQ